jgi:hypothetical protein
VSPAEVDAARAHAKAMEAKVVMAMEEREWLAREVEEAVAKRQAEDPSQPERSP